ncbi:redoxin domain-containing protein [Actinokineospora sp. 24-640]
MSDQRRFRARLAAGLGALALLTTACGAQDAATPPAPPAAPPTTGLPATSTAPAAPPAVPEKLAFTAKTVGGGAFDGASLAGKPAVLWFWTPWCPKCQREASGIAAASERSGGEVTFVGVAAQDTEDAMAEFIDKRGVGGFEHIADAPAAIWQRFGVAAQPAYAFISSSGEVEVVTEQLDEQELTAKVDALA